MLLKQRNLQPEWMDSPQLDGSCHHKALTGLIRINWWSQTDAAIWSAVASVIPPPQQRTRNAELKILDLATGGGDQVIQLARRLEAAGVPAEIHGCDISLTAVQFATRQAVNQNVENVRFFQHDVLQRTLRPKSYDIVMCSLFLHHLTEEQAIQVLTLMYRTARQLVIVDDLRRTRTGYWLAWAGARLLSRSRFVHHDGIASVAGAFSMSETRELACRAGWHDPALVPHWPQRFLMMERPAR